MMDMMKLWYGFSLGPFLIKYVNIVLEVLKKLRLNFGKNDVLSFRSVFPGLKIQFLYNDHIFII